MIWNGPLKIEIIVEKKFKNVTWHFAPPPLGPSRPPLYVMFGDTLTDPYPPKSRVLYEWPLYQDSLFEQKGIYKWDFKGVKFILHCLTLTFEWAYYIIEIWQIAIGVGVLVAACRDGFIASSIIESGVNIQFTTASYLNRWNSGKKCNSSSI